MPTLTFETPEVLIDRLERAVMSDWEAGGRQFGRARDPIGDARPDGWCVVGSPACHAAISREPFMLWLNPLEVRLVEFPAERRTRPRLPVARLAEMMPRAAEELLAAAAGHLDIGPEPAQIARQWLAAVDWEIAAVDPVRAQKAQEVLDTWQPGGATEHQVEREMFLAADGEVRHWTERVPAQALILRLIQSPSAPLSPTVRTAAHGALERLESLAEEMLSASSPDLLFEPDFRRRYQETMRVWVGLMDHCAATLSIPGSRLSFPTSGAGSGLDLRFRFPPRLLWLWVRRARRIGNALARRALSAHVEPDLVGVSEDSLDEQRLEMVRGVALLAAVMLQYNQGPPEAQEEVLRIAESVLPVLARPEQFGLRAAERGPRAARQGALIPRAVAMGRELVARGLTMTLARAGALQAFAQQGQPQHHSFPFKLGPEQPLPYAHLLTAASFDEVASAFAV